jgi:hypothetical protein
MSLWPSRGIELYGIEVKVSRGDWLTEMKNPAKAEAIARYCNRWYLAVSDASIVLPGELPPPWGLLALKRGRIQCVEEAPARTPEPISLEILAAIMRNMSKLGEAQLRAAREQAVAEVVSRHRKSEEDAATYKNERLEALQASVATFEETSGLKINAYSGPQLGAAVRGLFALSRERHTLQRSRDLCAKAVAASDQVLAVSADLASFLKREDS